MEKLVLILQIFGMGIVAYFCSTLVHEGGHVLCGILHNWKLYLLVVGPFKLYRENLEDKKVKFGIEKNPLLWCGVGGTLPREKSEENIKTFSKILLAGPFASIGMGIIMFVVFLLHHSLFLLMLALVPIAMGISCILPGVKTGILYNDGSRYLRIKRGGQESAEEKAVLEAIEVSLFDANGTYSQEGIDAMTSSKDLEFQYMGFYYAYLNAKKDQDQAGVEAQLANMERIRGKVPKMVEEDCPLG